MCWNEDVSLNTFLFSTFVLLLIIYNNLFSKYKIQELNNIFIYLFIASFVLMQLIEFFIWRNLKRGFYNYLFSLLAIGLLFIQPLCSLAILSNVSLRNIMIIIYVCLALPYIIYKLSIKEIYTEKSKLGHLKWNFLGLEIIPFLFWLFFITFSFIYENHWYTVLFAIVLLIICTFNYTKDQTVGSMWCWILNIIFIYYAFILLIYLPFLEKFK